MGYKETLKLRDKLKEKGYADSLWHIDDVKQNYKCDNKTAWECLNDALNSELEIKAKTGNINIDSIWTSPLGIKASAFETCILKSR